MSGMLSADDVEGRRNMGVVFCQKKEKCRPQELLPLSAHYVWSEARSIYLTVANILKGKPVARASDFVSKDSDDSDTDIPSAADILELTMALFFGYSVKAGAANLLPLPSLDGGHIVLAVLEGLTGISMDRIRPVFKKNCRPVHNGIRYTHHIVRIRLRVSSLLFRKYQKARTVKLPEAGFSVHSGAMVLMDGR